MRRITHRWLAAGAVATAAGLALTACGSGFSGSSGESTGKLTSSDKPLTVMIGSSGDAETAAVKSAVSAWSSSSGTAASVVAASDLNQQLSQGFASKKPADVFYLSTDALAGYASNGSLLAYGDQLANKSDFYPSLVKSFTYGGNDSRCSGTLIGPRHVITAAHCIVAQGTNDWNTITITLKGQEVVRWTQPADWQSNYDTPSRKVGPGTIAFTRTFARFSHSSANSCARAAIAAFVTA